MPGINGTDGEPGFNGSDGTPGLPGFNGSEGQPGPSGPQVTLKVYLYICMPNKNTLGVKKVRGQSEAALQIGMYDQKL